ncbi:uncharacterized protein BJ212DRAFT_1205559, partial [Suillus subaureus]
KYTRILTMLTTKAAELSFPEWTSEHAEVFTAIKSLVVSPQCLTTIDHNNPGEN